MPARENRSKVLLVVLASVAAAAVIFGSYTIAVIQASAIDLPTILFVSICGNATIDNNEACDDGTSNNDGAYASSTDIRRCVPNCLGFGPYCGDGTLQVRFNEECDDGNNINGDLCSISCREEIPVQPRATGAPPRGPVAPLPAIPGTIQGDILTKVVLRGKAYPNSVVNILLDGKSFGNVTADINADFVFTTTNITPGIAVFSFNALDRYGTASITSTTIFNVVQSAVTTVANIFLPPTIIAKPDQVAPGGLVVLSGQSVPKSKINTQINPEKIASSADTNESGDWSLQVDTKSLKDGTHSAKAAFTLSDTVKSGFGKSISFTVGNPTQTGCGQPDMNNDKKVNLVDFSIFLLSWNTSDEPADFNCDTKVNLADFSIMLFSWTG